MDFTELIDLAAENLGGAVLYANDEFFAPKENLLKSRVPVFVDDRYTEYGKWMDGWETRRRRSPRLEERCDWCIIRLGLPGIIRGIDADTSFFRGNFPSHCSLEACQVNGYPDIEQLTGNQTDWVEILPESPLQGDTHNLFSISHPGRTTHVRFKIYPDGGVARLKVYGNVLPDWDVLRRQNEVDLAAVENGGTVLDASDMFFGHRHNLIMPGRARDMSEGWETRRRRGPGHDWCLIALGTTGTIQRVEVDTWRFKGNYPESCSIEVSAGDKGTEFESLAWQELLPEVKLHPHTRHIFVEELAKPGPVNFARFHIYPDGGVSRLRLYGKIN